MHSGLKIIVPAVSQLAVVITFLLTLITPPAAASQDNSSAKQVERAASLIRDNRIAEAEQQLNYVLKASPNHAIALNLLGTVRAMQGKLNEAEALFSRAIRIDNQLVGAHMNLAYLYLLKGAPEKTALALREVLRLDPNNADASHKLAWLMLSQHQYDACISFIETAKQSQAVSAPLLTALGEAYLRKGDVDKAEKNYLLALNDHSSNADALLGLA
ncbi:MAG TPA: tetratricopeptide repeat protein, partial [Blastocatellia bacterium]